MSPANTNNHNHIAMCLKVPTLDRGVQIRQQVAHFETLAASEQPSTAPSASTPESSSSRISTLKPTVYTGDGRASLKERSRLREEKRRQSHGSAIERPAAPVPHSPASSDPLSPPTPVFSLSPEPGMTPRRRSISPLAAPPARTPRTPRTSRVTSPTMGVIPEFCPPAPRKERASRPTPISVTKSRPGTISGTCAADEDDESMGELVIGMSLEGMESIPHLIEMVERAADEWTPSI